MIRKASACYITTGIYGEGGFFFLSFFLSSPRVLFFSVCGLMS